MGLSLGLDLNAMPTAVASSDDDGGDGQQQQQQEQPAETAQ